MFAFSQLTVFRIMSPNSLTGGTMKALTLSHPQLTREALLRKAEEMPGAWAGYPDRCFSAGVGRLKIHSNCRPLWIEPMGAVKLIQKANRKGLEAIEDHPRPGRPSRFDEKVLKELDEALSRSPRDYGLPGNRWDGAAESTSGPTF